MRNLLKFLGLYIYSIIFLILFFFSVTILINDNFILKTYYFNSSNYISGSFYSLNQSVKDYFFLNVKNKNLEKENQKLQEEIINIYISKINKDSLIVNKPNIIGAEVINNSTNKSKNYLTLNKGTNHGISEGMGVLSANGVVGRVKYVSDNFSTVISLLNTSYYLSTNIKESNTISTINWDGNDSRFVKLLYVPKHIEAEKGNLIITSSFDSIFPKGIEIGRIDSINKNVNSNFSDITVRVFQNFYELSQVFVVLDNFTSEKLKLEKMTTDEE